VAKSKSERPDLILMDVIMPGTNGYEATRAITRDEATRNIPVIIWHGQGPVDRPALGPAPGARDYSDQARRHRRLIEKIHALS